jgi:hypothetical protein
LADDGDLRLVAQRMRQRRLRNIGGLPGVAAPIAKAAVKAVHGDVAAPHALHSYVNM